MLVYPLLDDQSDMTFFAKDTLCRLVVRDHPTQLLLSTMHGRDSAISSGKVNGFLVQDFTCQVTIPLPNTFLAQTIPARREQIPKPETALNWPHRKKIADQLMPYRDNVKVGLLIGSNCTRAIMPREVIPGNYDDPYALRTDLGWGIVGRVSWRPDYDGDSFGVTNRIITRNIPEPGKRKCLFILEAKTKEVINPFQISEMLELDFSERMTDISKKVRERIHQRLDGH